MRRVLFLGAGRRVELARNFARRGYELFSYELNSKVPIAAEAKIIEGYKWNDNRIRNDILETAVKYDVDLIIPCQDAAVHILSAIRFPNSIHKLCSPTLTAHTCYNKRAFAVFMQTMFPNLYPSTDGTYPIIYKPVHGFGSRDLHVAYNSNDAREVSDEYVIQKFIDGVEFSIDSYFDRKGKWVDSVPRERIRVGSGEVITTITVCDREMINIARTIGERLHTVGPTNTQVIVERTTDKCYVTEVNARFGGGWTLAMKAGLDAISLIERDYFHEKFDYKSLQWKRGLTLDRSYRDFFYENNSS